MCIYSLGKNNNVFKFSFLFFSLSEVGRFVYKGLIAEEALTGASCRTLHTSDCLESFVPDDLLIENAGQNQTTDEHRDDDNRDRDTRLRRDTRSTDQPGGRSRCELYRHAFGMNAYPLTVSVFPLCSLCLQKYDCVVFVFKIQKVVLNKMEEEIISPRMITEV